MSERKKVEGILSELGKKIDHLIDETKRAGGNVSEEAEKRIHEMKQRKEKLEEDFKSYKNSSGEKWDRARIHLNEAAVEIRRAFETIFKKEA